MSNAKLNVKIHKTNSEKLKQNRENILERTQEKVMDLNFALKKEKSASAQTRKRLTTVGRERRAFTQKSLLFAINHANLLPPYHHAEELQQWIEDEQTLLNILAEIEILKRNIYDRYYELTHQEYQVALKVYRRSKIAATEDEADMPAVYEVLKKMYRKNQSAKMLIQDN